MKPNQEKCLVETTELAFNDNVTKLCNIYRDTTPLITEVELDDIVKEASTNFDYKFTGENKFYPFKMPDIIKNLDFQILVITGSSGSGKSQLSKYFGEDKDVIWNNNKSIISNFESKDEGVTKLCATGLSSIPTWCRPYEVLSVGEKFRADLARKLKSNCVIDEFTSTVNRETALSCSKSLSKYIRQHNLQKCVFVSCHKDFIDCLCPDYVIDLDDECVYDTRRLPCRKFNLSVVETTNKISMWQIFKRHHYLTADLNAVCHMYIAYLNNTPVACCAMLPQPGIAYSDKSMNGNAWRVHRLVVLPDYQGLGIATSLLNYICDLYSHFKKQVYLRTSHIKLINYMLKSDKWEGDGKLQTSSHQSNYTWWKVYENRESASFRYVGGCSNEFNYSVIGEYLHYNDGSIVHNQISDVEYESDELFNIV